MNLSQWKPIAERIGRLWPPAMPAEIAEEYFAVLEEFEPGDLVKAITLISRQPRSFRPDVGLLFTTAEAQARARQDALPPADIDPLTAEEHELVLAENRRLQTAEHRRRHEAVVDLLRATGRRIPLTELPRLMATSRCSAEEFNARISELRGVPTESRISR